MIYDWMNMNTPRGCLLDGKKIKITDQVYWCNTETGECRCHNGYGNKKIVTHKPPLKFIPFEVQP